PGRARRLVDPRGLRLHRAPARPGLHHAVGQGHRGQAAYLTIARRSGGASWSGTVLCGKPSSASALATESAVGSSARRARHCARSCSHCCTKDTKSSAANLRTLASRTDISALVTSLFQGRSSSRLVISARSVRRRWRAECQKDASKASAQKDASGKVRSLL